jgi:uncharacterized protein YecE (DUF72 family)
MGEILYGTSSWSESSWAGVFYPRGMAPGDYLTHYAGRFPTVEADVTYYRVPSHRMVAGWERKLPDGFLLSAKFPRSVVHAGEGKVPDAERVLNRSAVGEDVNRFLEAMAILGPKCGPLILQFPYFNKKVFQGPEPFLERLDGFLGSLPGDFRFGVEVRNRTWLAGPLLSVLRDHGVALVLVDLSYMPHPADLAGRLDLLTAGFTYVRLIGDRKAVEERTDTFDKVVIDRRPRLERWAGLLRDLSARTELTLVYANNHYAGHAPSTIDELAGLVQGETSR